MKQITSIAAILLASLAAAGSASAQDHAVKVDIPFGFYVENQWAPAGTYILTSDIRSAEVVTIRNRESGASLLDLGHSVDLQPGDGTLVFHRYGDRYFLREIRSSAGHMHVGFNPSKREREQLTREASNGTESTVYLALK